MSEAKVFMEKVRKAERDLKLLAEQKKHYLELATDISVKLSGMPFQPGNDSKVEKCVIRIADLTAKLDCKAKAYTDLIEKANAMIAELPHERHRQVLTYMYLCNLKPQEVTEKMGYKDVKSVYRCNGWALYQLQKVITKHVVNGG